MVSLRFNVLTFQVLMVLPLLHLTHSANTTDMSEVPDSGDHVARIGTQDTRFLLGRRIRMMMLARRRSFGLMVKEEVAYLNGGQGSMNSNTPTSSPGLALIHLKKSINKYINARTERARNINKKGRRLPRRLSAGNFIPLNTDYHIPRPHPPKNN